MANPNKYLYIRNHLIEISVFSLLSFLLCLVEILFAVFHLEQIFELFHRWDIIFFCFFLQQQKHFRQSWFSFKERKAETKF